MTSGIDTRKKQSSDVQVGDILALESTLPLKHRKTVAPVDRVSILVFSHDAALANVIKNAARDQYDARVCDEWPALLQLVEAGHSRIVLLDIDALGVAVEKALKLLNDRADWLVIVIAAKQAQAQDFMQLWSERRIHRLLIKPASLGITRLLLESAVGRYVELRELGEQPTDEFLALDMDDAPTFEREKRVSLPAVAVSVLVILGFGLILGSRFYGTVSDYLGLRTAPPPQGPTRQLVDPSAPPIALDEEAQAPAVAGATDAASEGDAPAVEHVASPVAPAEPETLVDPYAARLEAAAEAEAAGRLIEPLGASALDLYLGILAESPDHGLAEERLGLVVEKLFTEAEAALLSDDLETVAKMLAAIRRAAPAGSRLRFLEQQLVREQASRDAARAQAEAEAAALAGAGSESRDVAAATASPAVRPAARNAADHEAAQSGRSGNDSELDGLVAEAEKRLSQGYLLEPAGDSARDYLNRAAALAPNSVEVLDMRLRLAESLIASARLLLAAGVLEGAEELAKAASDLGASSETFDAFEDELAQARELREREEIEATQAAAMERIERGLLITPEQESAELSIRLLQERDPDYRGLPDIIKAFGSAAEPALAEAIDAEAWPTAERLLSALSAFGYASSRTVELQKQLEFERMQAQYLATPAPVSELELLRAQTPVYPRLARDREITGWVDVEFIVDAIGRTRNIAVVNSEPAGEFEDSAVAAVEQYEFAPFVRNGRVFERRVRLRIRYALN